MDIMEKPQQSFPLKDFILAEKDKNGLYRPQNYCNTSPEKGPFYKERSIPTIIFEGLCLCSFSGEYGVQLQ